MRLLKLVLFSWFCHKGIKGTVVYYFQIPLTSAKCSSLLRLLWEFLGSWTWQFKLIDLKELQNGNQPVFTPVEVYKTMCILKMTAVDSFGFMLTRYFFSLLVLIRFITMLILNIWVTATILQYRKTKKTD